MSLIIRRNVNPGPDGGARDGVVIAGLCKVRLIKVDPDGTVHLAFQADRSISILREELVEHPGQKKQFRYQRGEAGGE